jgi:hypothetical protein
MKKIKIYLLSASFLFIFSLSNAQLSKGNLMVGGNMSAAIGNGSYQLGLYPSCGYFFTNNVVFGGALDLSLTHSSYYGNSSFIALSALGRYYFANVQDQAKMPKMPVFVQGKLGVSSGSGVIFASGGLGIDFFLSNTVALEASAGANLDNTGFANLYAMLGFQIFLPSSVYRKSK